MSFTDLTNAGYKFHFQPSKYMSNYDSYDFLIECWDDKCLWNLSKLEIEQLKENCQRILKAINEIDKYF